ncbi:MAG TPA: hypothetical protein VJL83_05735 [Patescibacteria group bacterium]|nr:hypothetical protein [Patescibacteria group bacterium]
MASESLKITDSKYVNWFRENGGLSQKVSSRKARHEFWLSLSPEKYGQLGIDRENGHSGITNSEFMGTHNFASFDLAVVRFQNTVQYSNHRKVTIFPNGNV